MNNTGNNINRLNYKENCWKIFLGLSILLFLLSVTLRITSESAEKTAIDLSGKIEKRLEILERYADEAIRADHSQWLQLRRLPPDMVIYRYVYDTLQSWSNQFPVANDDISTKVVIEKLSNLRSGISSPLTEIPESACYMNLGPKWYIIKSRYDDRSCRIIYGLEIQNTLLANRQNSESGVNPALKLPKKYVVTPISHTGGVPVFVNGEPLLKVISETTRDIPFPANILLRWIAMILFMLSVLTNFWRHPSLKAFPAAILILGAASVIAYSWGLQLRNVMPVFSPGIYAGGSVLFSFGALLIMNCFVTCYLLCIYLCRKPFIRKMLSTGKLRSKIIYTSLIVLTFTGAGIYVHTTLVSLIMNSSITLELYMWFNLSVYTVVVYASYIGLLFCMMLLLQLLRPVVYEFTGKKYSVFSRKWALGFSVFCALYLTVTAGVLGFRSGVFGLRRRFVGFAERGEAAAFLSRKFAREQFRIFDVFHFFFFYGNDDPVAFFDFADDDDFLFFRRVGLRGRRRILRDRLFVRRSQNGYFEMQVEIEFPHANDFVRVRLFESPHVGFQQLSFRLAFRPSARRPDFQFRSGSRPVDFRQNGNFSADAEFIENAQIAPEESALFPAVFQNDFVAADEIDAVGAVNGAGTGIRIGF